MKTHFIALGGLILFAVLAFAADVGMTAMFLLHS